MYRLVNESGNVFRETDSKRCRDALVAQGYVDITDTTKAAKKAEVPPSAAKKPKASRHFPNTANAVFPSGSEGTGGGKKTGKESGEGARKRDVMGENGQRSFSGGGGTYDDKQKGGAAS